MPQVPQLFVSNDQLQIPVLMVNNRGADQSVEINIKLQNHSTMKVI